MKRILLFFFILLSLSQAKASDTLTIRQVFNFNVGDTFDYVSLLAYQIANADISVPYYGQTYSRFVISAKTLSIGNDTITYIRHQVYPIDRLDTLIYTSLDSNILKIFGPAYTSSPIKFYTSVLPDGRLSDSLSTTDSTIAYHLGVYTAGLGLTNTVFYDQNDTFGGRTTIGTDTTLIYYAKGSDMWGATYYQYIGDRLPHYTPIPEECAYWNYILECPQIISGGYSDGVVQQVYTGNKVYFNNHTYVELNLRTFDPNINTITVDSVFGYFRNDTIGQKLYFTNNMNSPEVLLCDFTLETSDATLGNNFLHLDTLITEGVKRIVWYNTTESYDSILDYIEGIGSVCGFPGQGSKWISYYNQFFEEIDNCSEAAVLQSFCVCGQPIYQNNSIYYPNLDTSSGHCTLLTSINNIPNPSSIKIYPNPTTDLLHLSISDAVQLNTQLIITDILGQQVYSSPVKQSETTHDISKLASGIYTWRVLENNSIIKTGKVVKE